MIDADVAKTPSFDLCCGTNTAPKVKGNQSKQVNSLAMLQVFLLKSNLLRDG